MPHPPGAYRFAVAFVTISLRALGALGQGQLTEDGQDMMRNPNAADDPSGGEFGNGWWNVNYDLTDEFEGARHTNH